MHRHVTQILALTVLLLGCSRPTTDRPGATGIRLLSQSPDTQTFQRARTPRSFEFPRDHGMHEGFATEWWYFTGNLDSQTNRHFGFELTFFRYALDATRHERESRWGSNQIWLAHFTLTDTMNERFISAERMGRGALNIAGAATEELSVHVRDWSARSSDGGNTISLQAQSSAASIDLQLHDPAAIALHGEGGLDAKGAQPGNASYYYSVPRMTATGSIQAGSQEPVAVSGTAWLDREWATSSLDAGVEGWDWFGLQLGNGTNLMLYRLRNTDGSPNEFSTGTVMRADGSTLRLEPDDIVYEIADQWRSPESGVTYPTEWVISIPRVEFELRVDAVIDNQEFNLGLRYWEGAVTVSGTEANEAITGVGYLELAGYL